MNIVYLIDNNISTCRAAYNGLSIIDFMKNSAQILYQSCVQKGKHAFNMLASSSHGFLSSIQDSQLHFLFKLRSISPTIKTQLHLTLKQIFEQMARIETSINLPQGLVGLQNHRYTMLFLFTDGSDLDQLKYLINSFDIKKEFLRKDFSFYSILACPMSQRQNSQRTLQQYTQNIYARESVKLLSQITQSCHGACYYLQNYEKVLKISQLTQLIKPRCHIFLNIQSLRSGINGLMDSGMPNKQGTSFIISILLKGLSYKSFIYNKIQNYIPVFIIDLSKCLIKLPPNVQNLGQSFQVEMTEWLQKFASQCKAGSTVFPLYSGTMLSAYLVIINNMDQVCVKFQPLIPQFKSEQNKLTVETKLQSLGFQIIKSMKNIQSNAFRQVIRSNKIHKQRKAICCSAFSSQKWIPNKTTDFMRQALLIRKQVLNWKDDLTIYAQRESQSANMLMDNIRTLMDQFLPTVSQQTIPDSDQPYDLTLAQQQICDSVINISKSKPQQGKRRISCSYEFACNQRALRNKLLLQG